MIIIIIFFKRMGLSQLEARLFENPILGNSASDLKANEYRTRVVQILEACDPAKLATVKQTKHSHHPRQTPNTTQKTQHNKQAHTPHTTLPLTQHLHNTYTTPNTAQTEQNALTSQKLTKSTPHILNNT